MRRRFDESGVAVRPLRELIALSEFVIDGIKTTIPFHLGILDDEGFRRGEYHTEYLPQLAVA